MEETEKRFPGFIPVIKGNGYGFGNRYLADEVLQAGKEDIAVGTVDEARQLEKTHSFREMIVLTPLLTELNVADLVPGRVYTVGSREQLRHLAASFERLLSDDRRAWTQTGAPFRLNILIKCRSAMKRYGFDLQEAGKVLDWIREVESDRVRIEVKGLSIHFPKTGMDFAAKEREIGNWLEAARKVGLPAGRMYVSHLTPDQFQNLTRQWPEVEFSMRLGTDLWLSDKSFIETKSTVLDVKEVKRGERFGYKQLRSYRNGWLVCVAGGTANGVGLESPASARGLKERLKLTVFWIFHLFNLHLSPFTYKGKRLWFAEPPHMQTSVLFFPSGSPVPEVGEELPVQLRMTTATFDRLVTDPEVEELSGREEQEEKGKALNAIP
ncbi:alanine racemase [Melghirimyces profundicolus]|nr:alanine racemase [Melghirimyces profundicolus]